MYTNTNAKAICFIETLCAKTTMCVHMVTTVDFYEHAVL